MKKDIKNIQASIRAKLQNKAKETNRPFAEVLQYFGIERFLYKPLNAITKSEKFNDIWKASGSWGCKRSRP
jgi:hypothetical protein